MKYIVSNNRLSKLMLDYLDDKLINSVYRVDNFIIVYDQSNYDERDYDGILFEYDSSDGRLYVYKEFLDNFTSFFPIDIYKVDKFIEEWFESRFKVDVKFVSVSG
jgi:hypothetical protein